MKKINYILIVLFLFFLTPYSYANNDLVYVDNNDIDTKYHRLTCNHIFPNGYHSISVEEAFNIGYRRCPDCSPPMSDIEYNERLEHVKELRNSVGFVTSNDLKQNTNSTSTTNSNEEDVVYVTSKGSHYHLANCGYLDNSSQVHKVSLRTAINKGYVPCKVCNPYGMAGVIEDESTDNTWIIVVFCIVILLLILYILFNEFKYKRNKYYKEPKVEFIKKSAKNNNYK